MPLGSRNAVLVDEMSSVTRRPFRKSADCWNMSVPTIAIDSLSLSLSIPLHWVIAIISKLL
jgi:hypothetical protein